MKRTRQEKTRLGVMAGLIFLFFIIAVLRMGQLQLINGVEYREIVQRQSSSRVPIPAERGLIYDRAGRLVAKNVTRASLYVHPSTDQEVSEIGAYLESLFSLTEGTAIKKFKLKSGQFRWIKRNLNDNLAKRVATNAPRGMRLRMESVREYPFGTVGKQILGYTDTDNKGLSGFELSQDSLLAGKKGWADLRRDGHRNTFRVKEAALVKPVTGGSVVLTVDWQMQEMVEQELSRAVKKFNAESGLAVFMNCKTGEILSMAHFDPLEKNINRPVKLRAVTDLFEPGSSFKPFTAAALLGCGVINFDDTIYCEMGRWKVGRRTLRDDKEHGWLNFRQIIELSSNIGLGKQANLIEPAELTKTISMFGFGKKSCCGLPGESSGGIAKVSIWSEYNVAALAMGHSVAVTAIQMASAMSAIANGGSLMKPQLFLGLVDDNGNVYDYSHAEVTANPILTKSADSLRAFLRGVVEVGTGTLVNSEYVKIAGKTGTGQIPNLESGGYYHHKFTASFCGFFPVEDPIITGIVVLKAPHPVTYGGYTSGVAFRRIAERYTISNPDLFDVTERTFVEHSQPLDMTAEVPDLVGRDIIQAAMMTQRIGLQVRCDDSIGQVIWQFPSPDRMMLKGDEILVAVESVNDQAVRMEDLTGLSIRTASAYLRQFGIKTMIEGCGQVRKQSIDPGEILVEGNICKLVCKPKRGGQG